MFRSGAYQLRIQELDSNYRKDIDHGTYLPFTYPWGAYGALLALLYLLVPHRQSLRLYRLRWIVWGLNFVHAVYTIKYTRAQGPARSYAVGFGMAWSILWTTSMLLLHDGQTEFYRVQRISDANGSLQKSDFNPAGTTPCSDRDGEHKAQTKFSLKMQPFPASPYLARLYWVLDLMLTFRGMAWNWRIPNLPSPSVQVSINGQVMAEELSHTARPTARSYATKEALIHASWRNFVKGYIALDVLKTLITHDPYFWGETHGPPPAYLPSLFRSSSTFVQSYRLVIAQLCIYWALQTLFQLGPLVFVGLLGNNIVGSWGQYWMYPSQWGSYESVLERGLVGWWGEWWHQTFRFFFETPAKSAVRFLDLNPKSPLARLLQIFIAFSLSGTLHGCASYTSNGETRPLRGPFLFFLLQPVGIAIQLFCSHYLRSMNISQKLPNVVKLTCNFVFVHFWLYYTAPLLVEDIARGGQLLWEPVPFSFVRGMGFGRRDDTWYCWGGLLYSWHQGKYWWQSGLAT
ncbi:hypothetical protein EJ08DRAFT_594078 [Tothia fuscella]|uniref:Wax synthase domain-containing protein n=1 Tax=Tothia fuscella TaxID=1048955 RepID=A0A9P4TVG8_9PEZI|nr:hypothetical protein EJ08DRAFT_594078 [Tothia fuscella]